MFECFVNRKTKELLVSLEFENDIECKGNCWNDEYDVIKISDEIELKDLIIEKEGKKYLNFKYAGEN